MMQAKAIIFDLDDTLVDREETFSRYCCKLIDELFSNVDGQQREEIHRYMLNADQKGYMNRACFFQQLVDAWGLSCNPDLLLANWHDDFGSNATPMPGLHDVIRILSRKYKLAIITNGTIAMQNRKIDALQIRGFIDAIVISEEVGYRKPCDRIYHMACHELGVSYAEAIYVGDNYTNDIEGAVHAGLRAIWLCPQSQETGYQPRIANLSDLLLLL